MSQTDHFRHRIAQTALRLSVLSNMSVQFQAGIYVAALYLDRRLPESNTDVMVPPTDRKLWPRITIDHGDSEIFDIARKVLGMTDKGIDLVVSSLASGYGSATLQSRSLRGIALGARILEVCNGLKAALELVEFSPPGDTGPLDELLAELIRSKHPLAHSVKHLTHSRAVKHNFSLPLLAQTASAIARLCETSSIDSIAKIASDDPVTAGLVLQCANSIAYRSLYPTADIKQAVLRLGVDMSCYVLKSACLLKVCVSATLKQLWAHSLKVATTAATLAGRTKRNPDVAFTAGLLHDIGRFAFERSGQASSLRSVSEWKSMGYADMDAEILSYAEDHAVAGANILAAWGLPTEVVEAVRYHHRPELTDNPLAGLLYIAEETCSSDIAPESEPSEDRKTLVTEQLGIPSNLSLDSSHIGTVLGALAA